MYPFELAAQILAEGLSPLVQLLRKCWHEPYVAAESVRAGLVLFAAWAVVSNAEDERGQGRARRDGAAGSWRWRPLEAAVSEVVTLVTARLVSLMDAACTVASPRSHSDDYGNGGGGGGEGGTAGGDGGEGDTAGGDAQVLLAALDAAAAYSPSLPVGRARSPGAAAAAADDDDDVDASAFLMHPGVETLGDRCVSLLAARAAGGAPLPPTAHLLAIASLEIVVRPRSATRADGPEGAVPEHVAGTGAAVAATTTTTAARQQRRRRRLPTEWNEQRCKGVVLSLLLNRVEGRVSSKAGGSIAKGEGRGGRWLWTLRKARRRRHVGMKRSDSKTTDLLYPQVQPISSGLLLFFGNNLSEERAA